MKFTRVFAAMAVLVATVSAFTQTPPPIDDVDPASGTQGQSVGKGDQTPPPNDQNQDQGQPSGYPADQPKATATATVNFYPNGSRTSGSRHRSGGGYGQLEKHLEQHFDHKIDAWGNALLKDAHATRKSILDNNALTREVVDADGEHTRQDVKDGDAALSGQMTGFVGTFRGMANQIGIDYGWLIFLMIVLILAFLAGIIAPLFSRKTDKSATAEAPTQVAPAPAPVAPAATPVVAPVSAAEQIRQAQASGVPVTINLRVDRLHLEVKE